MTYPQCPYHHGLAETRVTLWKAFQWHSDRHFSDMYEMSLNNGDIPQWEECKWHKLILLLILVIYFNESIITKYYIVFYPSQTRLELDKEEAFSTLTSHSFILTCCVRIEVSSVNCLLVSSKVSACSASLLALSPPVFFICAPSSTHPLELREGLLATKCTWYASIVSAVCNRVGWRGPEVLAEKQTLRDSHMSKCAACFSLVKWQSPDIPRV